MNTNEQAAKATGKGGVGGGGSLPADEAVKELVDTVVASGLGVPGSGERAGGFSLTSRGAKVAFLTVERERAGMKLDDDGAELTVCLGLADQLPDVVFEAARERRRAELLAERTSPSGALVSSVELVEGAPGCHDRVRIWNRGALCGELVVANGDGIQLRERLTQAPPTRALRAIGDKVDGLAHDVEAWVDELLELPDVRLEGANVQRLEDLASQIADAGCFAFAEAAKLERGPNA